MPTRLPRRRLPDLVIDDPDAAAAYILAAREHGLMAPFYLFHGANISEVIRPGDTVVDLGCGAATQLAMVARLNPLSNFIGVDVSQPMLAQAQDLISREGLNNVTVRQGDISDLSMLADASVDAVVSTMALHQLPDSACLARTYAVVARILKADGGIYMADFAHLKTQHAIDAVGNRHADRQPKLFTEDYLNALEAAFYLDDFRTAARPLLQRATLTATAPLALMVALKSPPRRGDDPALRASLAEMRRNLPDWQGADLADLVRGFRRNGMRCALLAQASG